MQTAQTDSAVASFQDPLAPVADFLRMSRGQLVQGLLEIVVIWAFAWLGFQIIRLVARRIVRSVADGDGGAMTPAEKRGQTIAQLVRSVGRGLIIALALLLSLDVFMDIRTLLAGAGILGLAVSFGAQSLVKDLIGGFFILLENQFGVGDVVEAGGKAGTVEGMTLRVVLLRDLRGVLHIIPNGQIGAVSNLTRGFSRAVVEVGVAYDADLDHALDVFKDEAMRLYGDPEWRARFEGPPDVLGVEDLSESGVVIRTVLRTAPGEHWPVAREFRRRIKNRLDAEGIEIPFPQRTVHLRHEGGTPGPGQAAGSAR